MGKYLCAHNQLKAHALAYHIYDTEFRGIHGGKIGAVNWCSHQYSYENETDDLQIENLFFEFNCGWVFNPIFSKEGDYPAVMKKMIAEENNSKGPSRMLLPQFSQFWINLLKYYWFFFDFLFSYV